MPRPSRSDRRRAIDRQISDAIERGDFDDLPGKGKPIPDLKRHAHDENWWVRDKLKRENVSYLPPALELRRTIERWLDELPAVASEGDVRSRVAEFNEDIRALNREGGQGPASNLVPLDVDDVVSRWRATRT